MGNYFGAGPVGLSIYENQYEISLKSKSEGTLTEIIKTKPLIPFLTFENFVLSKNTKKDEASIYGAPFQNKRIIRGAIPSYRESFTIKGSIPDPTYLAAYELNNELRKAGISTTKTPTTSRILNKKKPTILNFITSTKSPQLSSIIKQTNLYSVNLFAEHLINQLALQKDSGAYLNSGVQVINEFWKAKGLDLNGFYMEDGCGLSRFNSITSKQLVDVLTYMNTSENAVLFKASLPVAGKSGTLRNLGKGTIAANNISAKSGYMTRVRSYSGYVTTKNNRKIAFALIVNNYNCTAYQMKKKMELIMIKLAEIER
jgi:D-alanyl-D-alanine carboxypeptidase/D-alanyl-D-alanine-endopeptidase (penicillin-binding protein 4)